MTKSVLDYSLKIRLPLTLFVVIVSFLVTFYVAKGERDGIGYKPEQPINYSHKLHAGDMKIDCRYCHTGVSKGRHALVPSTNICMNCHSLARKNKSQIITLTTNYENNKPINWIRIHKVPEYAYFNHSVHVNNNLDCESCHGNIRNMDVVTQMRNMNMTGCLECHRNAKERLAYIPDVNFGPENCSACHR